MSAKNIYAIPAEKSFVDILAQYVLERYSADPLALSRLLILLPSRRSCRSLREAFLRIGKGRPLLLPRMQPIGDIEEDSPSTTMGIGSGQDLIIPPAIAPLTRLLLMTQLVHKHIRAKNPKENIEQAARLARELLHFIDQAEREQIPFSNLTKLVPQEFALHWQITLDFFDILFVHWPEIIRQEGAMEPMTRRNFLMRRWADAWRVSAPTYPVIAAGTTGSIPATAELLKIIASLEQGFIILPGFDRGMTKDTRQALTESHPQYSMKQLLQYLEIEACDVQLLDIPQIKGAPVQRTELISQAMLPAPLTVDWRTKPIAVADGLQGVGYMECATQEEEAQAIALLLRARLETLAKTAALVTHDRALARRVAASIRRYGIVVDDSAGVPLANTPPAVYLRLVAGMAASQAAPVELLALLKHPLAGAGLSTVRLRHAARVLEKYVLRGVRVAAGLEGICAAFEQSSEFPQEEKPLAGEVLNLLNTCYQKMLNGMQRQHISLQELIALHITCAESLAATDEEGGKVRLWRGNAGKQLAEFCAEFLEAAKGMERGIDPAMYSGLFNTAMAGYRYRPHYNTHPRLHILSPMEARLQHYDFIIMGGMNEGSWPPAPLSDAWMSRPMRESFGLPPPEHTIGLSAHDFSMLFCAPEVMITRSRKVGGQSVEASRWLTRLEALIEGYGYTGWKESGHLWTAWARALDKVEMGLEPMPAVGKPPVETRPRSLSATHIETLMRDPYAVYASHILKLKPLPKLDEEPDHKMFGLLVHQALQLFIDQWPSTLPENALEQLLACGRIVFKKALTRPAVAVLWWPRYERLAKWVLQREQAMRKEGLRVLAECDGIWKIPAKNFLVKARLDRVEYLSDGSIRIIDYKTGSLPGVGDVKLGYACQLPVEGLIALRGSIERLDQPVKAIAGLEYWKLSGGKIPGEARFAGGTVIDVPTMMAQAEEGLHKLITYFDHVDSSYPAAPIYDKKPRYSDYEHLSRAPEWMEG